LLTSRGCWLDATYDDTANGVTYTDTASYGLKT